LKYSINYLGAPFVGTAATLNAGAEVRGCTLFALVYLPSWPFQPKLPSDLVQANANELENAITSDRINAFINISL